MVRRHGSHEEADRHTDQRGDCPGLSAAIRGVVRAGQERFAMRLLGFRDGFRGLVHDRTVELTPDVLSGTLTYGGTILGTSRDKPHRMQIGGKVRDMTDAAVGDGVCRASEPGRLWCHGGRPPAGR